MANPLYQSMCQQANPFSDLAGQIQRLKESGITDPNKKIQEMLNSGQISQQDYNRAVQRYQQMQAMFGSRQ